MADPALKPVAQRTASDRAELIDRGVQMHGSNRRDWKVTDLKSAAKMGDQASAAELKRRGVAVPKVVPATEDTTAAQTFVADNLTLNLSDVTSALTEVYGDAWQAGTLAAGQAAGGPAVDWGTWEPGNLDAAINLSDGGLQTLLDQASTAIDGIRDTTLDRLGSLLSEGVLNGDSIDTIAGTLLEFIDDPQRAYMIADTETARAVESASQDRYEAMGVSDWDWLVSPDACDECQDYADDGPYPVGGGPDLPAHPLCRCSSAPRDPGKK